VGDFPCQFGRTIHTQAAITVPADLQTDPFTTAGALFKVALGLLNGLDESLIVFLLPAGRVHFISNPAGSPENSSENPSRDIESVIYISGLARLKSALVAVFTDIAVEFKLKSPVRGKVSVIVDKFNQWQLLHLLCFFFIL
jgi:hypothetical protein